MLGLLAACGVSSPTAEPAVASPFLATGPREVLTNDGAFRVRYVPDPDPIPFKELFDLTVDVAPVETSAVVHPMLRVHVAGWMPEHNHGMVRVPEVEALGTGRFAVRGLLLHMPGYWELSADVFSGANSARAVLPLLVE